MASAILHIKDSYYFEVPKSLWRSGRSEGTDFPEWWIRADPDFQEWQADHVYDALAGKLHLPAKDSLLHDYEAWKHHDHTRTGVPFSTYLLQREDVAQQVEENESLRDTIVAAGREHESTEEYFDARGPWSDAKLDGYNRALDGKILIPQPFGPRMRNLYEKESGFAISRFMIIELVVALVLCGMFIWLANRLKTKAINPRGRIHNMLEAVLIFMRDEVAKPAIGKKDAAKFTPLLWTIFLFILGCNLFGMLPWAGAPTGAFAVTLAMAAVTLGTGVVFGVIKFGPVGYLLNQIPSMDLPLPIAIFVKPMLFVIEFLGLLIKHGVLGVRLLANMVAGHIVLLAIMMLAFNLETALSGSWYITAPISVIGSTLFSCLELFVAFLQAYVFTFLSALFIGAAIHHH